jgi:hypothetical protein
VSSVDGRESVRVICWALSEELSMNPRIRKSRTEAVILFPVK